MLSRSLVPLLRRQTVQPNLRPTLLSHSHIRCYARIPSKIARIDETGRDPVRTKKEFSYEPVRPVPRSKSELEIETPPRTLPRQDEFIPPVPPRQPRVTPSASNGAPRKVVDTSQQQEQQEEQHEQPQSVEPGSADEPQMPLPDLTKGIPSTIDAELDRARGEPRAHLESLNITEDNPEPQRSDPRGAAGDGLPRSAYVSSSDRKRSRLLRLFYAGLFLSVTTYALYQGREWDTEEEAAAHKDIPNGYSPSAWYARAKARYGSSVAYYTDPVTKKLLPDLALLDPLTPEFVLVLGLEDLLIKSDWSREHGWRIAKRPGLDYFLRYLSMYYELVIFSAQPSFTVDQISKKLDPYQMAYPLFREMTTYENGGYVKDLSYLNRDLKKVVIIDTEPHAVSKQPENAIVLPKWEGDPNDTTLIDFIPFLEYLANIGFKDTREVLKSFEGKYIPAEFDRRQKLIRQKFEAEAAEKRKSAPRRAIGGIGSFLGGAKPQNPDGSQTLSQAEREGKMIFDQIRERGKENYARLAAYLDKEGPKIIAEREALEKKAIEQSTAEMKSGMFGWFGGGGGTAKPADSTK